MLCPPFQTKNDVSLERYLYQLDLKRYLDSSGRVVRYIVNGNGETVLPATERVGKEKIEILGNFCRRGVPRGLLYSSILNNKMLLIIVFFNA